MLNPNDSKTGNRQEGPGAGHQIPGGAAAAAATAAKPAAKPVPDKPLLTAQTPPDKRKLVGQNYTTPDMIAKVTGKSKYAEDYRADGMLFTKLLLSPYPHARITHIDARRALAMPGVKAVLTMDDLPAPADSVTDLGVVIKANKRGERGLAMEPVYMGEPVLALAAVDEVTAADAIEKIHITYEPLPFVVDPFVSLRPGGPNARTDGNTWMRPPSNGKPGPPPPLDVVEIKWSEDDFKDYDQGKMPMGKPSDQWSYGDVEAGFKNAALVMDETFMSPNTSHQCLETRTVMAYWQGPKLFVHAGTQSTVQTIAAIARWMNMSPDNVVLISEYTGGGFGSKITASIHVIIPALLSKKCNAPVMMRISREEEHFIGRGRPSITGRIKCGFTRDGRITAIDMYSVLDNGPYDQAGDCNMSGRIVSLLYQPPAMRWRGISVLTNTTPRSAQSSPGGLQGITIMEPLMAKAARQLKIDQVELHKINAPEGKAPWGPPGPSGKRGYSTSCFIKQALTKGAERFKWNERIANSGKRVGTKVRGVGVSSSTFVGGSKGYDGLFVIRPDGRMYIQTGIGNLGTENFSDAQRVAAEIVGIPWEKVVLTWGNTSKNLPWSCASGGSQTTHAMTRAAYAAGMDAKAKLQEIAAKTHGGKPENYEVGGERVYRRGGGASMTLAQAAQQAIKLGGKYDGSEPPTDVNKMTVGAAKALAGQGLMGVARDNYPQDGQAFSFVASFAEVEVDLETGSYKILDFLAVADVGTVIHPKALGGQVMGRSMLGISHAICQKWVFDQHLGAPLAKRFYNNKPPTILDAPDNMEWAALDIPDPETPVGARGVGEPPVGGGCCAVLNALSDALGDEIFRRAPVTSDIILTSLEAHKIVTETLTAQI
ncbi:MAG TPA: xanthine dehydrogenase family protein molybdopterin-binding subunit [Candidatus Acidoferrales bacterium]|nr:xanthine dehydrogenase family protein molybdopterin-binding subunit [Candidatus Acidoferrales bacterium]